MRLSKPFGRLVCYKYKIFKDKRGYLKEIFKRKFYKKKPFVVMVIFKKECFERIAFAIREAQENILSVLKGKIA